MNDIGFAAPGAPGTRPQPASSTEIELWPILCAEAARAAAREEILAGLIDRAVLSCD